MNFQSAISFLVFYIFLLFLQIYIDKGLLFKVTEPFFLKKVIFEILFKNEIYLWKIKEKSVNFTQKLLISNKRETNLKKGLCNFVATCFLNNMQKKISKSVGKQQKNRNFGVEIFKKKTFFWKKKLFKKIFFLNFFFPIFKKIYS